MFWRQLKRKDTSRHSTRLAATGTTRPAILSRVAGIPAGLRQTRRGSFLIMVVGTLALLSVITVIYVSVGRSDSQTSAAALKHEVRDNAPEQIRDYIAGIIAADLFDTVYLGERDENGNPIFRREAWDYPSTAYSTIIPLGSVDVSGQIVVGGSVPPRFHFTPTGNGTGTDPWLASSEPTLLNFDGTGLAGETMPADYYLERLDWLNLSNVAPDGSFVNLYNLRGQTIGGVSRGNFDATPWEMRGDAIDSNSSGAPLTLFEDSPEAPSASRGFLRDFGGAAQLSSVATAAPADWTSRQRWAVFPKVEPQLDPGDPSYLLYQYADADGDGILDSRWFEMVEDRDPTDQFSRQLLDQDDRLRYFVATRIIDLSGRVNVNTATDSTPAPVAEDPYGLNPAAVDLRRLLTLEDFATDTRTVVGYSDHLQPNYPNAPDADDPENYEEYSVADHSYFVGEKAYDALRMVLDTGMMPERGYAGLQTLAAGGVVDREFSLVAGGGMLNPYWDAYWKLTPPNDFLAPSNYYSLFSGFGSGGGAGYAPGGGDISSGLGRPFGLDSLFDLLVFNGVNDDTFRSPLEVALSGRADPDAITPSGLAARFGPLRDNRSPDLERTRGEWLGGPGGGYLFYDQAKAALYTDIRHRLTTHNGNRPITPSRIAAIPGTNEPDPADLALDMSDTKRNIGDLFSVGIAVPGQALFETYADALAPYSDNQRHWDPAHSEYLSNQTLYYGYRGPYLAIQTAGMLAVNMLDAYDQGNGHTKRTLLFNGSIQARRNIDIPGGRSPNYPWKLLDLDANFDSSDLNAYRRLWDNNTSLADMPDAINVFGIEAQPFITEAASFIMYTDTPAALGGDDDSGEVQLNGNRFWRFRPSINGEIPTGADENPDFLFQVLAFQIHNPFDETLVLSGNPGDTGGIASARRDLYYIQYGDLYFKFTDVSNTSGEAEITLGPQESVTLYALSQDPNTIAGRFHTITGDAEYGSRDYDFEKQRILNWLDRQLGEDAILIPTFEPETGTATIPSDTLIDLQQGGEESRSVVKLWRVEKPEADPNGGFDIAMVDETLLNRPDNDTLVDRMREPDSGGGSPPLLDRRLWEPGDNQQNQNGMIGGAIRGPEPPDAEADDKDNRGLSITRYAVIRRNGDTRAGSVSTVPRGSLPAYCLELKDQTGGMTTASNDAEDDGGLQKELDISDFNDMAGDATLDDLLSKQSDATNLSNRLVPTISMPPESKADNALLGIDIKEIPDNLDGVPFTSLDVEPHLNNSRFETPAGISTMRVADLLLPLGIAPHQIPDPDYNDDDENIEWTTLSEALAIALYYENPSPTESVYSGVFVPHAPGSGPEVLLDRGGLQYTAFVPYFDALADGMPFDPTTDTRWGLGVPAAANLFDTFTTLPPKFGSITNLTHGQINVNTASREVLRSLPGLSPPDDTNPDGSPNWWWTNGIHDERSDIATMLAVYRDRIAMYPRDVAGGTEPDDIPLNFRDRWQPDFSARDMVPPLNVAPGSHEAELAGENARWGNTGVMGIREGLGIRSLGEIAFLRDWGYVPDVAGYAFPHDIDRLGYDGLDVDQPGIDSVSYGTGATPEDDQINDDYDERLALASSVMASSSIRSDVFAVWFLVHGYQESDVKGLGINDPLVPSVARRFVMVVDRSNVTEPGQKPRILLFKEVPL